jgi:hypothetical protein
MATRLFYECPLIVMVTAGRLPLPSASTTLRGTSRPRMGSGGSTCVRTFIVFSCELVSARDPARASARRGDLPEVAVRVGDVPEVATPIGVGGIPHDAAAGPTALPMTSSTSSLESTMKWNDRPRKPESHVFISSVVDVHAAVRQRHHKDAAHSTVRQPFM